ncbi:MAG: hypothetical protein IJD66_05255 [Methanocorpusculum sp.]|nr:hypothetical protein [Methanocorpusculum sp.]MBQ4134894.1 hypothetical protein [Methanocorpusculum sp.]
MNRRFVIFSLLLVLAASIFSAGCISPDVPNVSDNPDVQEMYEQAVASLTNPPTGYELLEAPVVLHYDSIPSPNMNIIFAEILDSDKEGLAYAVVLDGAVITPIKTGMLILETNGQLTHITIPDNQESDQIVMITDGDMKKGYFSVLELTEFSYGFIYVYVLKCIDAGVASRNQ